MIDQAVTPRPFDWIPVTRDPGLPIYAFVYARYPGESREEAEAVANGYGQPADAVNWAEAVEFRLKNPELYKLAGDQIVRRHG